MADAQFLDIAIEICVIFLIIFTPLAFGAVGPGPQVVSWLISGLIFFLWVAKRGRADKRNFFLNNIFFYLFVVFCALALFQAAPLPKGLLKILSPAAYNYYLNNLPGYESSGLWLPISIYPDRAITGFFNFFSYGIIAIVIASALDKKPQIYNILGAAGITGFVIACFGIIQKFTWNGMIYWMQPVPQGAVPFGPFVNKNHFAGFMELTIPIAAVFTFIADRIEKRILFGFMALVMLLALFVCASRAGISSFLAAAVIVFLILFLRKSIRPYIIYVLLGVVLAAVFAFIIEKEPLIERFAGISDGFSGRRQIYGDVLRMVKDFALFGAGHGNFKDIFPAIYSSTRHAVVSDAHSDWLQFLAESGSAGFLCIITFIWLFFKDILCFHFLGKGRCFIPAFNKEEVGIRHDRFVLAVITAGLISITSIIFHGFFDINLHIFSNGMLFCIIAAVSAALAHKSFKRPAER